MSHQEGKQCLNINKYPLSVHISNSLTNIKCREFVVVFFYHLNICVFKVSGLAGEFYVNLTQDKTNFERTSIEEMPSQLLNWPVVYLLTVESHAHCAVLPWLVLAEEGKRAREQHL